MEFVPSDDIAASIRTRHVQTPLDRVVSYPADAASREVLGVLVSAGFDFAPVTQHQEITGTVAREDLVHSDDPIGGRVRRLTGSQLIAGDTPLATLMRALSRTPFLFVVDGREIVGIVTPSDLNKQPGRTYFYLLVAAFELSLAERVRSTFPDEDEVFRVLPERRHALVRRRLAAEGRDDVVADVVAALDFTDLLLLVEETEKLRVEFGHYDRESWQAEVCTPLINLRHDVMHMVRTLATDAPSSLAQLIALDEKLHHLLAVASGDQLVLRATR